MLPWCPVNTLPRPVTAVLTQCLFCRVTVKDTVILAALAGDALDSLPLLQSHMIIDKEKD